MTTFDVAKIDQLQADGFKMIAGVGSVESKQACAMSAIAWAATGEWTDMPTCVHRLLSRHVQRLNDSTRDVGFRWRLAREAGPVLLGTESWPDVAAVRVMALAGRTVAGLVEALAAVATDLTGAYLFGANLSDAYLTGADLFGANLSRAYLTDANLSDANLTGADLTGANLTGANLTRANLSRAYLTGADLTRANLSRAYLTDANLTGADLTGAYLFGANLSDAYLTDANLSDANLTGAYLTDANLFGARGNEWTRLPDGYAVVNGQVVAS